ncbi:hypothetical protein lerEdw1_006935 [Lerista edwardsae]|nr:hypothetical protein lerEdw1_006935 [Lerista edwardsae]
MPPDIMSSHLTSPTESEHLSLVCCDHCGFGMAKVLPPESSRPTPVGKLSVAAMLLDCLAKVTMVWVKKWLSLWQSFPATLLKAILMGIAKGAYRVAMAAAPLEKTEMIQSNDEVHNLKAGHLEHLILSSLESLVKAGHLRKSPKQLLNSSNSAEMEEEHVSEQCLINSSISFDFGSNWEDSSEEDMGLDNMKNLEKFSPKWLEDCYNPPVFTKTLAIGCYSPTCHRKIMDAEGIFCQGLGSPSASLELKEGLESSGDFATNDKQSADNSTDSPGCGKHLESDRKDKDSLGAPAISHGFKSPLVLSLFYSPSEEEEEEEENDSEDWWSEDEMEESHQSQTSVKGGESGQEGKKVDDDLLQQDVLKRLSEPFFLNNDLCSSEPSQVLKESTVAPSEPPNHKEITVSFFLTKTDSQPTEFCNPAKHPWPPKGPRANCRHPAHECYPSSSWKKCDPIATEMPPVSQEQNQVIKKVRFSPVVTIHPLIVWDYASRAARRGPWEEMARDRSRFSRRITEVGAILEPCLEKEHRAKAWKKMNGVLE